MALDFNLLVCDFKKVLERLWQSFELFFVTLQTVTLVSQNKIIVDL